MRKKRPVKKRTARAHTQVLGFPRAGSAMDFGIFAGGEKPGTRDYHRARHAARGGKSRKSAETFSWSDFARLMSDFAWLTDEQAYD
jgi:hypothetical protein